MIARSVLVLSGSLVALLLGPPCDGLAQQSMQQRAMDGAQPAPAAAEIRKQGDVSYLSGGVGDDSERAIKALAQDFNLHITLATPSGEYLSGTKLEIKNGAGKTLLEATSDGPLFYAKLPAGAYTIRATAPQGETKTTSVDLTRSSNAAVVINLPA